MKADVTDLSQMLRARDQYIIPVFQRTYVWQHTQWIDLWEDLKLLDDSSEMEHFLGSIVCAAVDNSPGRVTSYVVVDGQQRLVTLFALLCALRDIVKPNPSLTTIASEIQGDYLIHNKEQGYGKYKILPRAEYRESFLAMIEGNKKFDHEDNVVSAYSFFKERLSAEQFNDTRLKDFLFAVTRRLKLVLITLSKEENPFPIFEALNGTGIDVLQSDMIRNFVFMKMDLDEQDAFDSKEWKPLENLFAQTHNFKAIPLDNFYKHFLMSNGEYVGDKEIFEAFKDQMGNKNAHQIVSDLRVSAPLYLQMSRPELVTDGEVRLGLSRIHELDQSECFPLLLDLLSRNNRRQLDRPTLLRIVRSIESFILRRRVLGLTTRHYAKWFAQMCGLKTDRLESELYQIFVIRGWPRDSDFIPALSTYEMCESGIDRMILVAIEESLVSNHHVDMSNLEVQRIMPRTILDNEEGQSWKTMLGTKWQEIHRRYVDTLGNLTLARNHPELGHSSFTAKKTSYEDNRLELNKYFHSINSWREEEMKARSENLAKLVAEIWPTQLN